MSQTVLVADDSQTIRKVVEMALKASQFEVVGVSSAREAVEAAKQQPTVILLDYYMPDGSGYDVCRALKNNNTTSAIPVIMLGGTYKNFDANLARDSGASQVVMKPFRTDELVEAIEEAVSRAESSPRRPEPPQPPPQVQPPPMDPGSARIGSRPSQTPVPESQPRIPVNPGSQPRVPPSGPQGSQPHISTPGAKARQRTPTPRPGSGASSMPTAAAGAAMSREEIQALISEEVKDAVRAELPGLLRNVMGEVFQQKVLPKLLQHSDDKIQRSLDEQLSRRITQQVRAELERLLAEE